MGEVWHHTVSGRFHPFSPSVQRPFTTPSTTVGYRRGMVASTLRLAILAACAASAACAGMIVRPVTPQKPATEAVLILPGFGYGPDGEKAIKAVAASMAAEGMDLYVPTYISRRGLAESRANLQRFIRDHRLDRYERVHVFAFLAGGWTFNPLAETAALPLATVVYDRSPFQERAPRIASGRLRLLTWLRYGSPVADVARTPYPPLTVPSARVALMVETKPTSFIRRYSRIANSYGPYRFECDTFSQRYDDCLYLPMDHGEVYLRFGEIWPELLAFIRTGRFTSAADRTPPPIDALGVRR
jgi:hypothetical protein